MQNEKQRRKKLWMAAIKPPMYTVAYVPILVRCLVGSLLCSLTHSLTFNGHLSLLMYRFQLQQLTA